MAPRIECNPGDPVLVDVRNTFADPPVLVPATFLRYTSEGDYNGREPQMETRIEAVEPHPWARHNGTLFRASASPVYARKANAILLSL